MHNIFSIYIFMRLLSQVKYLLCYACAGSQFQMCAMRLGTPGTCRFRHPLSLANLEDRLQIIWIAVQSYWIMKAQAKQLPVGALSIGCIETTTFSKVQMTVLHRGKSPLPRKPGLKAVAS